LKKCILIKKMILENRLHITIKLYLCGFEKIFNKYDNNRTTKRDDRAPTSVEEVSLTLMQN